MQTFQSTVPLVAKPEYGNLVNPLLNKNKPVYNWYLFKHSYSKELVTNLLDSFEISRGDWVLDPFCGCGTTILACRERGISAIGFDILPFSVFLTNAKIDALSLDTNCLRKYLRNFKVKPTLRMPRELSSIGIIKKGFEPRVLSRILQIRNSICQIPQQAYRDFFMLGLLGILEQFSQTQKGGGFLRLVPRETRVAEVLPTFKRKVENMIQDLIDIRYMNPEYSNSDCHAEIGDARKLPTHMRFAAVITSPPYLNRHDYTRIYALELIIGFLLSNSQLKAIRYKTLRSHVEAQSQFSASEYVEPEILGNILNEMPKRELNNKEIVPMIKGYFEDMYLTLQEISRCLRKAGKCAFVVSNVRFAGLTVPVDLIVSEISEQVGLITKQILMVRFRGNSSQQMARYKRVPSRESIVILEKR
jgi:tRNA G10  N-methylase Trm11